MQDSPSLCTLMHAIETSCWVCLALICITGVASSVHVLWALHSTPRVARRQFMLDHLEEFSAIYVVVCRIPLPPPPVGGARFASAPFL